MSEIANSTSSQTDGIEQINTAISQMNQITQQNAAMSEESASTAEELSNQSKVMRDLVAEFKISFE